MAETKTQPTKTETKKLSRSIGALWKRKGSKADGTPYEFLSGNLELSENEKIFITVNKSKIPAEERAEKKSPDYLIYKDDYKPKAKMDEPAKAAPVKQEEEPF